MPVLRRLACGAWEGEAMSDEEMHRKVFTVASTQADTALLLQLRGEISAALKAGMSFERFRARWLPRLRPEDLPQG